MKRFWMAAAIGALGVVLAGCSGGGGGEVPDGWPTSGLAEELPTPSGTVASVDISDEELDASIEECSVDKYNEYVTECEDMGYTVDADKQSSTFEAYSEEGYKLSIMYWDSSETMDITLTAPLEMSEITWPSMGAGSLVPAPSSTVGLIDSDSSTFFYAYVGETDQAAFSEYVNACADAGFTVDYDKGDTWYYADDASGNSISLNYQGFNTMTVRIDAIDSIEAEEATGEGSADSSTASADFKATMDEYEAFFNEYVDFMNAYSADPSSPDLLAQYSDMMTQYSEVMAALDGIDTESLSTDDYAYYTEVMARITTKLAEVGQ